MAARSLMSKKTAIVISSDATRQKTEAIRLIVEETSKWSKLWGAFAAVDFRQNLIKRF